MQIYFCVVREADGTTPSLFSEGGTTWLDCLLHCCSPNRINRGSFGAFRSFYVYGGSRQDTTLVDIYKIVLQNKAHLKHFCCHRPEKEPQFKFIYFNHMNLAEKSTIHMRKTASVSLTSVHPDLMKILGDINCDFARYCARQRQRGFEPRQSQCFTVL